MSESREVQALRRYLDDSGVAHVVTCTTNHSQKTASGNVSRHVQPGTGGQGLALDAAPPGGGTNNSGLLDINMVLARASHQLYELIYAGPGNQCFKAGHPYKYPEAVMDGHHNHVHVSIDRGVFLQWPHSPPANPIHELPSFEVAMQIKPVDVTITTDSDGNGWQKVGYPVDRIISALGPGLRPGSDNHYGAAEVGLAPEDQGTIVSITDWFPGTTATVRLRIAV